MAKRNKRTKKQKKQKKTKRKTRNTIKSRIQRGGLDYEEKNLIIDALYSENDLQQEDIANKEFMKVHNLLLKLAHKNLELIVSSKPIDQDYMDYIQRHFDTENDAVMNALLKLNPSYIPKYL
jgi:hypothetical protein